MAVSIVEGSLESFELKRRTPAVSLYHDLVIRHRDSGETRFKRAVAARKVADKLKPGATGRFFLFESIDRKGIHGLQLEDGSRVHAFSDHERANHLAGAGFELRASDRADRDRGEDLVLPLIIILLAAIVYPLYRRTHLQARDQFVSVLAKAS